MKHGAILPLIRMSMDAAAFPECARFAGFVLCNLASNRMNRVQLVRAGYVLQRHGRVRVRHLPREHVR